MTMCRETRIALRTFFAAWLANFPSGGCNPAGGLAIRPLLLFAGVARAFGRDPADGICPLTAAGREGVAINGIHR